MIPICVANVMGLSWQNGELSDIASFYVTFPMC